MFGLFKKSIFEHPSIGVLIRSGRVWHGTLEVQDGQTVQLEMSGTKDRPHEICVNAALEIKHHLPALKPAIAEALLEHLEPYQEALSDPDEGFAEAFNDDAQVERILAIKTPQDAWNASAIEGVEVGLEGAKPWILVRFEAIWDIEHRLGAHIENWQFTGLNGSV